MTLLGTLRLDVRGNELGHAGVVPLGTLSRYGETARWEMFRDPSCALHGKLGSGVARAQHVVSHVPLTFPGTVEVETVLAKVGRTSLEVVQRITDVATGTLHATLRSTVVKLGPDGPAPLDASLAGLATHVPSAPPPAYAAPGADAFSWALMPRASDMDQFRHVNQARYVDFADDIRYAAVLVGHPAGLDAPIHEVHVDYRREAKASSRLEARLDVVGEVRSLQLLEAETGLETTRIAFR